MTSYIALNILFFSALAIQLCFYLGIFSQLIFRKKSNKPNRALPVSVIICAHNEAQNLKNIVTEILKQDHQKFELIVVNDRSTDDTLDILNKYKKQIKIITIDNTPTGWNKKKHALTTGIEASQYDYILLTDADCTPQSQDWISIMAGKLTPKIKIVLGVSPYQQENSFVNKIIQFETLITAIQYISFAISKIPYMGIGRNILYDKSLFISNNGFDKHKNINGGDDDLLINRLANSKNTVTCIEENAYVLSIPESSIRSWISQKHRHLSVGQYYRLKYKLILGSFHFSNAIFYLSFFTLLLSGRLSLIISIGFLLRTVTQITIFDLSAKILKMKNISIFYPLWDLAYTFYSWFLGTYSALIRKKKW